MWKKNALMMKNMEKKNRGCEDKTAEREVWSTMTERDI